MTNSNQPVKTFDLYASFSCTGCGACCRHWQIPVDRAAVERATELLQTVDHPGRVTAAEAFTLEQEPTEGAWATLRQRDDGACVFLEEDNSCYWHRHFGYDTKGWVCRAYPNTSKALPQATLLDASLSCPPLTEALKQHARPMRLTTLTAAEAATFSAALDEPRWTVPAANSLPLGSKRRIDTEALLPLIEALLEFPQVEGAALGARLMMGRLFLEQLIHAEGDGPVTTAQVAAALAELERDGTALYVKALDTIRPKHEVLAASVRGFIARMARIGVPSNKAARFTEVLDALHLNAPRDTIPAVLDDLHRRYMLPSTMDLEGLLAAYACHRLVTWQGLTRGGVLMGYTEVLIALLLVWAFSLARAALSREAVTADMVAEAIQDVERVFFHTPRFTDFLAKDSGFEHLGRVAWASVAVWPLMRPAQ